MPRKRPVGVLAQLPPEPVAPTPFTEDDSPTIGMILGLDPVPNTQFVAMADEPEELPEPGQVPPDSPPQEAPADQPIADPADEPEDEEDDSEESSGPDAEIAALNERRQEIYAAQRKRYPDSVAPRPAITPDDADFAPSSGVRYESRIQIVDAWRYPGSLSLAPDWVDRNWVGYADDDPLRGIPAGPCLRVPSSVDPADVVLARIGDYVCRQSVVLEDGLAPVLRTEVWTAAQFTRMFMPVSVRPDAPRQPPAGSIAKKTRSTRLPTHG